MGLHPEKHCGPWGLCHGKWENDKKQTATDSVPIEEGRCVFQQQLRK